MGRALYGRRHFDAWTAWCPQVRRGCRPPALRSAWLRLACQPALPAPEPPDISRPDLSTGKLGWVGRLVGWARKCLLNGE